MVTPWAVLKVVRLVVQMAEQSAGEWVEKKAVWSVEQKVAQKVASWAEL